MSQHRGISIIMPCYNAGEFVEQAVQSIHAQDFGDLPYEIILVDDGSIDQATSEAIDRLEQMGDERLIIHRLEDNIGQSAARNFALRAARYPYIFPVDADDMLSTDPKLLAKKGSFPVRAVEMLEQDPDLIGVYPRLRDFGSNVEKRLSRPDPFSEKRAMLRGVTPVCAVFHKQDALAVGGYDETLNVVEDWAFWIDLMGHRCREGRGRKLVNLVEPYYLYRQHDHGMNVNSRPRDDKALLAHAYRKNPELYHDVFPGVDPGEMADFLWEELERTLVNDVHPIKSLPLKFRAAAMHPGWLVSRVKVGIGSKLGVPSKTAIVPDPDNPGMLLKGQHLD